MITQLQPTQVKGLKEDYEDLEKLSKNTRSNKLPRSQAVAVFYFENHSVLNVRLITGSLLSSTGKTTFSPTPLSSCAFIPAAKLSGNSAHGFKIQARNTDLYDCRLARERSISVRFCLRKRTLVGVISKYSSPAITSRPRSIVSS